MAKRAEYVHREKKKIKRKGIHSKNLSRGKNSKQYKSRYKDISKYRLTLDYEEDYWLLKSIINILGQNPSRDEIENLFNNNPDFHKINYFRNSDWKDKQNNQTKNQLKEIN